MAGSEYPYRSASEQELVPTTAPPKRRGASCFLIGCLTVLAVVIIAVIAAYFVLRSFLAGWIEQYTDTEPLPLPAVVMGDEELEQLFSRVETFKEALRTRTASPPLVLSGDEINALIQHSPEWEPLRDKVYVSIGENQIQGQVSIPLDEFVTGRYLNGSATFTVFLRNGIPFVFVDSMEVLDTPVPQELMAGLSGENLAKNLLDDPEMAEIVAQLESIEVKDGLVTITPKAVPEP